MNRPIHYLWGKDHLLIRLGDRTALRIKMLYYVEFFVTIGMATIFLIRSLSITNDTTHWLVSGGVFLLYSLAAYRFISRIFFREELRVTGYDITIIKKTPFSKKQQSFDWDSIGPLHYAAKAAKTDHPLKGNCFDYFGFETQEQLIQNLHHDGNLYFISGDEEVRFARGIYSWNAEELINMIKLYAGNALKLGSEWKYLLQEMEWREK